MATCKQTAAELIQDAFSPCVAVLCSSDVEAICAKNNLTFVEMVQPFCRLNTEITIRDPSNVPCSIRNLRIHMKEMNSLPPPPNVGKKIMHDAVANNATEGVLCNSVQDDIYNIKYSASTPWFEAYREVFLQVTTPTEHEFMHHYLSCIFVVSSSHSDPLSQIHKLCQEQQQCQLQNSRHNTRWFFTYIFKYYLLLHDMTSESLAKAEAVYQSMKSSFGASVCHLLQINSSSVKGESNLNSHAETNGVSNLPDPWSQFLSKFYTQQETDVVNDGVEGSTELSSHCDDVQNHEINNCLSGTGEKPTIHHPLLNSIEDLSLANDSPADTPKKDGTKSSIISSGWGRSSNRNKKHGLCLTLSDLDRIRVFVQDFCIQGLVPFVEKQIRILNDQVTNRKSIHRTIFGVTKKLFTGNKPGVQGPVTSANSVVYAHDAPELQVRKLGDLAFMFQLYEVAYQAFYTAKRDFSGEAWLHFAGASEMAALSVFMQNNSTLHEYPARYMESAITTYLYTCKLPELAIRATLLSTECLKAKGLYKDATCQFNRILTDADLPSALLLEQAAHCAINCKPPYIRKYMFNLILAGHRFSKCGQRKHSLRAYKQVEQAYDTLGWNAARNHIKSLIGRTSVQLKQVESAYTAFYQLLSAQGQQTSVDQGNCLRDYIAALKEYLLQQPVIENSELPHLPVPVIDCQSTKILLGEENSFNEDGSLILNSCGFEHGDRYNDVWAKLEEIVILSLHKSLPPLHTPQIYCFTQSTSNSNKPVCIANETVTVEIVLRNPLNISFAINNVYLVWTYTSDTDGVDSKEPVIYSNEVDVNKASVLNSVAKTQVLSQVIMEPLKEKKLHLTVKPVRVGSLSIKGLSYCLQGPINHLENGVSSAVPREISSLQGKQLIELKGPRLNKSASDRATKTYAIDNRLNLQVISPMPKLQVKYKSFPRSLFCGEIYQTVVEITNVGEQTVKKIVVSSPTPLVFVLGPSGQQSDSLQVYKEVPCSRHPVPSVKEWDNCDWKFEVKTTAGELCCLRSGESVCLPIWFRGPDMPGQYNIELLFYYETDPVYSKMRHRLLQHSSVLIAKPSLTLQAKAMRSQHSAEDEENKTKGCSSLLLSLVAGNNSEELTEINAIQVSCVSPKWHVSSSDEFLPKGIPVILQKECVLITLKALSSQFENLESSQKTMIFSHVPLGCFEVDSTTSPCSDFISRSRIRPEFLSLESQENARFEVIDSQNILLLLTVIWKAKVQRDGAMHIVTGQHHMKIEDLSSSPVMMNHIPNKNIIPQTNFSSLNPLADHLVHCYLNHPFHVQHDFRQKRLVTVPVDFIVQSTCSFSLQILLDNSDNPASQVMPYSLEGNQVSMSQLFTWVRGSRKVIELQPGRTACIPLQASFSSPGTYNLGCLNVRISSSTNAVVTYIMSPYLIIISACDVPIH